MIKDSKLAQNFFSLGSIQILNYILPLVTLPYLVRTLGPHNYGLVMFAQAIVQYLVLLTSYGFNLSATPQISLKKQDADATSNIISAVIIAKTLLVLLALVILTVLILWIPALRVHWLLYVLSFGYVLADFTLPVWLFQGLEDMKFITLANVISKGISTTAIFCLIHSPSAYLVYPVVMSLSNMFGGSISLSRIMKKHNLKVKRVAFKDTWSQFRDGWLVFVSTVAISLYTTSNPVILGMFTSPVVVGYYTAAEKLINSSQGLIGVLGQTIYPYVTRLIHTSVLSGVRFLHKVTVILAPLTFLVSISIFALSGPIVRLLLGPNYGPSILILRVLSILPFVITLSNLFGIQTMLTLKLKKSFSTIILIGAVINIALSLALVPRFGATGTAVSVTASEVVITLSMFIYLSIKGINLITGKVTYYDI